MKNTCSSFRKHLSALAMLVVLGGTGAAHAGMLQLSHTVNATDNLFATDWGHWFTMEGDEALLAFAPGSTLPSAVANGDSAYDFSAWDYLDIAVSGSVTDAGAFTTGADGCPSSDDDCWFGDGQYHYQDVYSVIGLWSSSSDSIAPILTGNTHGNWIDALFAVGSSAKIDVPDVENAYLFLAENDRFYSDNSGFYSATIIATVPEPGTALLLFMSLAALFAARLRR